LIYTARHESSRRLKSPERVAFLGASTDAAAESLPDCGDQLKSTRANFLSSRSYCDSCARKFRATRFLAIAGLAICLTMGYGIGHYRAPREQFYLIGSPVDPAADGNEKGGAGAEVKDNKSLATGQLSAVPIDREAAECGARTKSGKPCRRKVVGGGYCWQHRDKSSKNKSAAGQ
jgi:hypothetical protein